jgi:predicted nucleic acid-binding protein
MIVPDASVVLKWFLPEADRDKALALVAGHISGYEVSNILTVKSRLSAEVIFAGMRYLYALGLRALRLNQEQSLEAIRLARSHQLSVYDASYVALAITLRATFITADARMARKLQGLAFVKTLGELGVS